MAYKNRHGDFDDHQQQQPRARFNKNEFMAKQQTRQDQASSDEQSVFQSPTETTHQPREDRPARPRNDQPREKKFHAEMIPLNVFEQMLEKADWVIDIDQTTVSFYQVAAAQKAQTDLYYTAYRNGAKHMEAWYRHQVRAVTRKIRLATCEAAKKERERCEAELITGDEDFDEFARQVRAHDWFYQYSDDGGVFRRGADNHERLEQIAKERGGVYLKYFAYYPTRLVKTES